MTLTPDRDPMGRAIADFFEKGRCAHLLLVRSEMFDDDEMPVPTLFRTEQEMNALERHALSLCRGRVLDVGAGAGCHSLALQAHGLEVTAIDISPCSVETMRRRGVASVACADFFADAVGEDFDTLLFLMNGIGIAGRLERLPLFFARAKALLAEGGQILFDSSDLRYIYEDEDGEFLPEPDEPYYGEVDFRMEYGKVKGAAFDWLYVDFDTLKQQAAAVGLRAELLLEGDHYDYLARLVVAS